MSFDLHRQLQELYAGERGSCEVVLDNGFVADVVRDGIVYEIQTRALRKIRTKIAGLLDEWPVVIVYPISRTNVIIYGERSNEGEETVTERSRRISPKHGTAFDLFAEAVSVARLLAHPNLSLDVVLVDTQDIRVRPEPKSAPRRYRRRRRRQPEWVTVNRRLVCVHETLSLDTPADGLRLMPNDLPERFTNVMLGEAAGIPAYRARQITYTLRHLGALVPVHRTKEGIWYRRADVEER